MERAQCLSRYVPGGARTRFSRLHTLELPRSYQLKAWVDIHRRAKKWSRRLKREIPLFVRAAGGHLVPRVHVMHILVNKRVLDCRRSFEVHGRNFSFSVARAFGDRKRRFIDWLVSTALAVALGSTQSLGVLYSTVSGVGHRIARAVTIRGPDSAGVWEVLPLLEAGGVGLHAAVKRSPLLFLWRQTVQFLTHLGWVLGAAFAIALPWFLLVGIIVYLFSPR